MPMFDGRRRGQHGDDAAGGDAALEPARSSSCVSVPASKNFSISPSSASATISISASRAVCAGPSSSAGIAPSAGLPLPSARELPRLHRHQIDDAAEGFLFADRQLHGHDRAAEGGPQGLERPLEAGALAIEAVEDDDARDAQLLGGRPDLFGRTSTPGDGVHDHQRGIRDAQRRARVAQEIRHPRRVDEVDLVLVPLDVGEAAGEGVLAGDFFFVVIGDGRPVVHAAEAVDGAGVEEQRGNQLRLPGAAMTDQGDISDVGSIVDLHAGNPPEQFQLPFASSVPRKKQIILKFVAGTQGMEEKSPEIGIRSRPAPSAMLEGTEIAARTQLIAERGSG